MTIYLDEIFIENLIMDFIILKETGIMAKVTVKNRQIIIAAFVSSIYVILMLVFKITAFNYVVSKLFLALLTTFICFLPKSVGTHLKEVVLFFLVSIINVGAYTVFSSIFNLEVNNGLERSFVYIATYYLSKTFLTRLWKMYRTEINKKELNYTVELKLGETKYIYDGFLDTGNTVYSHGMPVIFAELIDEKMLNGLDEMENFEVKTVTLGNVVTKKAYVFENIKIKKKDKYWRVKAGVVFEKRKISKLNNYNMILNYVLYTESMGGIKI